ncbi:hypothetical protein ACS5PN_03895 [Roseateles sp. NT4]|uniref:hypothetical protein n=1 Tax=Roseateles sp. NT4 TaxID=3453715 RepID=UPI003EED1893
MAFGDINTINRFLTMARHVKGKTFAKWPGWSTGETLAVALILNRPEVLKAMDYTALQAVQRVDILDVADMEFIARQV